jgi:hypothetical protein
MSSDQHSKTLPPRSVHQTFCDIKPKGFKNLFLLDTKNESTLLSKCNHIDRIFNEKVTLQIVIVGLVKHSQATLSNSELFIIFSISY